MYKKTRAEGFGAEVKRRILIGTYVLSHGYYDAYYLKAQKVRRLIAEDFAEAFEQCDVIVGPTAPTAAFKLGAKTDDPVQMYLNDIYTIAAQPRRRAGMSIPCGFDAAGCRSGCRSWATISPRRRMLNVAHQYPAGDRLAHARPRSSRDRRRNEVGSRHRAGNARAAVDRVEDLLGRVDGVRRGAQHAGLARSTSRCPACCPVLNRGAVERAIRFGLAVGGTINRRSVFARKNYFYPDLPKGYQISQYEMPVVQGGIDPDRLADARRDRVRLTRAHLEEDAGKTYATARGFSGCGMTGIDLNRAGTPLLEIVSEPDMRSAEEAVAYAKALHALVRWIGICDGNMQEGTFRCDANVSVRRAGETRSARAARSRTSTPSASCSRRSNSRCGARSS